MHNPKLWSILTKHLSEKESPQEKEIFLEWLNESEKNKNYFRNVKAVWNCDETTCERSSRPEHARFRDKFTLPRIKAFIIDQALGNLVGFTVGIWVVSTFSHRVLEKKGINNLFGLMARKHVVVNEIPLWMQRTLAVLIGFIALELINHFFKTKKYMVVWNYIQKTRR